MEGDSSQNPNYESSPDLSFDLKLPFGDDDRTQTRSVSIKNDPIQHRSLNSSSSPEPMSLNQRSRVLLNSCAAAPTNPNPNLETKGKTVQIDGPLAPQADPNQETKREKVKLTGRRRLCKAVSDESGPQKESENAEENISDILDDFSLRLESLSLTKERHSKKESKESEELYFSSKEEGEEEESEGRFGKTNNYEDESFKVVARKTKTIYSSDESEDEQTEILEKGKGLYKNNGTEEKHTEIKGKVIDLEDEIDDDYTEISYRSNGRTSKKHYISSDDDYEEEENQKEEGNEYFTENEEEIEELKEDFAINGVKEGRNKIYKLEFRVYEKLYPHQKEGINWLWGLYCKSTGGILGDDMGLGKTMQISAFLAGLFESKLIKRVLIVAPKTLIAHWIKELSVVGLSHLIRNYSGANLNFRNDELNYTHKEGGILITTYDIVRNNYKAIRGKEGKYRNYDNFEDDDENNRIWDYTILDEGHIIKNPSTQRAQSLYEIPCPHRIIISGTPIQNNLKELWALFHFCCPELLGDKDVFRERYEKKILRGNEKDASNREKYVGSQVAKELRERIKPYFLRRLKSEVFGDEGASGLPKKNEMIIWLKLTTCQRQIYEAFLKSELVVSDADKCMLAAITILKKICDHPLLLTKRAAEEVLDGMDGLQINENEKGLAEKMAESLANGDSLNEIPQMDYTVSCKILFILSLLENLVEEGHTTLIFSQSRKMLDHIQEAIRSEGYNYLRIDGTTKISEREKIVRDFQEGIGANIFLLTTQVGGLGLTLTKADRVIVVDPAWNPSMDNQSVDRAYRIGQTKDVIVYRLMTCGTIEEKIYQRQVFKGGLFKTATEQKEQTRYFSRRDIEELFRIPEQGFDISTTQRQLQEEHDRQIILDEYLANHIKYLEKQDIIGGVSHHSLLFSKTAIVPAVPDNQEPERIIGNQTVRSFASSSQNYSDGANYAFKPKDAAFNPRKYSPAKEVEESPESIRAKIKRLSDTLSKKDLVMKLPDRGEKIRKQLIELEMKLNSSSSPIDLTSNKKPDIISLDDVTSGLGNLKTF
ncbi:hypothetical protein LUZ60_015968 [Juncus effusus]|nr:hypothetical protein LUZ60_015968 [Juncus effusus]